MKMGEGLHLLLDGVAVWRPSRKLVATYLIRMVEEIDMTPIAPPHIYLGSVGWVGFQLIAESHISIHQEDNLIHADIFSCKSFDVEPAIELTSKTFGAYDLTVQVIKRGGLVNEI